MPTIAIIAFLFAGIFAGYTALQEYLKLKRFTSKFWFALLLFLGFIFFGLFDILDKNDTEKNNLHSINDTTINAAKDTKETIKKNLDSASNYVIQEEEKNHRKYLDSLKNIFSKRTQIEAKRSILDLLVVSNIKNPSFVYSQNKDSIFASLCVSNYGNDLAKNLIDRLIIVNFLGEGTPILGDDNRSSLFNKSYVIIPDNNKGACLNYYISDRVINGKIHLDHEVYIYLRIDYTNSVNVKMKPFQQIFLLNNNGIFFTTSTQYEKVQKVLEAAHRY